MERRYQVFVSSTFDDLREERAAVIGALLQMDCFPTGMELFPAADEDSWTLIENVIADSDYYLIVLAGRYGSVPAGETKSFTHLEYEHALRIGKPTIALLHSNPGALSADKTERSDEGKARLDQFRDCLRKKNCRLWVGQGDLTAAVFTGIQHLKKTRPSDGWVKGSELADASLKDELLRLRREIDSLNGELAASRSHAVPEGTEELAQGDQLTTLVVDLGVEQNWNNVSGSVTISVRWGDIFRAILPQTLGGGADPQGIASALASLAEQTAIRSGDTAAYHDGWRTAVMSRSDYGKVMNQMVALGLVVAERLGVRDTVWYATPYGIQIGSRLLAVKKDPDLVPF
jgi:hypothetical protein